MPRPIVGPIRPAPQGHGPQPGERAGRAQRGGAGITAATGKLAVMATGRLIFEIGAESLIVAVTTALARYHRGKAGATAACVCALRVLTVHSPQESRS